MMEKTMKKELWEKVFSHLREGGCKCTLHYNNGAEKPATGCAVYIPHTYPPAVGVPQPAAFISRAYFALDPDGSPAGPPLCEGTQPSDETGAAWLRGEWPTWTGQVGHILTLENFLGKEGLAAPSQF